MAVGFTEGERAEAGGVCPGNDMESIGAKAGRVMLK